MLEFLSGKPRAADRATTAPTAEAARRKGRAQWKRMGGGLRDRANRDRANYVRYHCRSVVSYYRSIENDFLCNLFREHPVWATEISSWQLGTAILGLHFIKISIKIKI